MAIGAERTQEEHVHAAYETLCKVGAEVLAQYALDTAALAPPSIEIFEVANEADSAVLGKRRRGLTVTLLGAGPRGARALRSVSCSETKGLAPLRVMAA